MSTVDVGSLGVRIQFYERMWYDVYVGRCVAGDEPADAIERANDAVTAYQDRSVRRETQIREMRSDEVYA